MTPARIAGAMVAAAAALAACGGGAASVRRALITDDVAAGEARAAVRAWHEAHGWCRGRTWPDADELVGCDPHPYLERHTPPVSALITYRGDRVVGMAVFVPVPCRMTGFCDRVREPVGLDALAAERARIEGLAGAAARREADAPDELPSMPRRMLDALEVELDARYGAPRWHDALRSVLLWQLPDQGIELFLTRGGGWVVEAHHFLAR